MILSNTKTPLSIHNKDNFIFECDNCGSSYKRRWDSHIKSSNKNKKDLCKRCANKNSFSNDNITNDDIKSLTIQCKKCLNNFKVPLHEKNKIYCSEKCQINDIKREKNLNISNCLICRKEFEHYGSRIVCSRDCLSKYMSEQRINENNPSWIKNKKKSICPKCNNDFEYTGVNLHKGQKKVFCSLACSRGYGNNKKFIENKKKSYKYPRVFNKKLKIKIRDNNKCQLCGSEENLEVHHIDYIKKNCDENNLITLCRKCHNITHDNRGFWTQVFIGLKSNSKIVRKGWGLEIHIVNHNDYCLKYLIFFKGKKFSWHMHPIKKELWLCTWGEFECIINTDNYKDYFKIKVGDKVEILPKVEHQVRALKNSIILEVSSRDYLEDSIRIEKGD